MPNIAANVYTYVSPKSSKANWFGISFKYILRFTKNDTGHITLNTNKEVNISNIPARPTKAKAAIK